MKRLLLLILVLNASFQLFSVYEIGDIVEDFSWLESDGGEPVTRSLHDLIDQEKVVLIFFGGRG